MRRSNPASLAASRQLLRVLIVLNWLMGTMILALLVASMVAGEKVMPALGFPVGRDSGILLTAARVIMLVGVIAAPITNVVLTRLRAIVDTVRESDPFVLENAVRLNTIAWAVLSLELLHIVVGIAMAYAVRAAEEIFSHPIHMKTNFSITPWLAVLLLFVLARVFEQGALMREELEGTV